jgi:ribosomal protein S18 acetylase RimI-like enzyme
MAVLPSWWEGRDLRALLPKVFFEHFRTTSFIVEHEDTLVAFLVGFLCADHPDEAYVHFVGIAPAWRGVGLGRDLYRRFFALARADDRRVVRAVTAPVNVGSIAFHTALGFSMLPGDDEIDGVPVSTDHGPHGDHLVHFQLFLEPEAVV